LNWSDWFEGERPRLKHRGHLAATGAYSTHVSGEAAHQDAFEQVLGGRTEEGAYHECTAFLVPDADEGYDADAIGVYVAGCRLGYLTRDNAEEYRAFLEDAALTTVASCDALIEGGWARGTERGMFSIRLDLEWPPRLEE
jgi:hypothetical protein